jgi:hypothetical protein
MKSLRLLASLLLVVNTVMCTQQSAPPAARSRRASSMSEALDARVPGSANESDEAAQAPGVLARQLIHTGSLDIEVSNAEDAIQQCAQIAESLNGFIASTEISKDDLGHHRGSVTVRVPAQSFQDAVSRLGELGDVRHQEVATEDVTKSYTDLEIRLSVKRQTEARLRELLSTQARKLSDVLEVERELGRIVEEIERIEGEKRYYDNQIALSTISVRVFEPGSSRAGFLSPISQALRDAATVLGRSVASVVYAAIFLAPWLLLAGVIWWLVRILMRRKRATIGDGK